LPQLSVANRQVLMEILTATKPEFARFAAARQVAYTKEP